jgi:hypothetical protein
MRSQVVREVGTGASSGAGLARNAQPTACACSHALIMRAPPPAVALPSVTCRSACRCSFGADVGESRRRCGRVAAQRRASRGADAGELCVLEYRAMWSRWGTPGCVVSGEPSGCAVMTNAGNLVVGAPTIDVAKVKARAGPVGRPPAVSACVARHVGCRAAWPTPFTRLWMDG